MAIPIFFIRLTFKVPDSLIYEVIELDRLILGICGINAQLLILMFEISQLFAELLKSREQNLVLGWQYSISIS